MDRQTDEQMDRQTQMDRQRMRQTQRQRENSCFSTFDLITMDRLMDQQTNGWTDGQTKPLLDSTTKGVRDLGERAQERRSQERFQEIFQERAQERGP